MSCQAYESLELGSGEALSHNRMYVCACVCGTVACVSNMCVCVYICFQILTCTNSLHVTNISQVF